LGADLQSLQLAPPQAQIATMMQRTALLSFNDCFWVMAMISGGNGAYGQAQLQSGTGKKPISRASLRKRSEAKQGVRVFPSHSRKRG
jgi:hypothetical protein